MCFYDTLLALLLQIELFQSFPWSTSNLSNSLNALPVYHPQSPFVSTIWPHSGRPALPMVFIKSIWKHKKVSWAVQTPEADYMPINEALLLQVAQDGNVLFFCTFSDWTSFLSFLALQATKMSLRIQNQCNGYKFKPMYVENNMHIRLIWGWADMEFVQNFTPPDFQAKNFYTVNFT